MPPCKPGTRQVLILVSAVTPWPLSRVTAYTPLRPRACKIRAARDACLLFAARLAIQGHDLVGCFGQVGRAAGCGRVSGQKRSEEHTSELQSLMRTSYAVFCLKKKNKQTVQ